MFKVYLLFASIFLSVLAIQGNNFTLEIFQQSRNGSEIGQIWRKLQKLKLSGKFAKHQRLIDNRYLHDYVATRVSFGTPVQKFIVSMETGRPDLWVMDPNAPYLGDDQKSYDASKSSTSKYQGFFKGRTGEMRVNGKSYVDVYDFGNGITFNQQFGVVNNVYKDDVDTEVEFDGVLGLSWLDNQGYKAPILNILEGLSASENMFTFWLGPHRKPSEGRTRGQFTPVDIDYQHCESSISYAPLKQYETYQSFQVDTFSIGKFSSAMTQPGTVDTGMSVLLLPQAEYQAAYKQLNPEYDSSTGLLVTQCSNSGTFPDISFKINGKQFNVPSTQYILDLELSNGNCALAIGQNFDIAIVPNFVLGNPFLRQYCTIFDIDNKKIGFTDVPETNHII